MAITVLLAVAPLAASAQDDSQIAFQGQPQGFPQGGFGGPGAGGFGPGGPGPGFQQMPMMPFQQMPEMAKKMASIMALRQMMGMRLTANDIAAALPILRSMREAEKALEAKSSQLLDEEKRFLLTASPENPPQVDIGEKMARANEEFRQKQEKAWDSLSAAIGREKTMGIRSLLGQGGPGPGMMGPGRFNGPPGGLGGPGPGAGPGGFGGPPPGQAGFGNPNGPGFPGGQPPQPGQPGVGIGRRQGGQGNFANRGGGRAQGGGGRQFDGSGRLGGQQPGQPGQFPGGPPQGGFGGGGGQFPGGPPGQPGQGPGIGPGGGGPFGGQGPGPGMMGPGMGFGGPRVGLSELIDLLEQKLAAMKGR